ncbi:MAG: PhoX family phosphatase [Alphaproteobacteria bacterium]|nr:PhoX family phosphatase [Alphaproteobacteria bacterium]
MSEAFERDFEDQPVNPTIDQSPTINDVIEQRYSRRGVMALMGSAAIAATTPLAGCAQSATDETTTEAAAEDFVELARGVDTNHQTAGGLEDQIVIRWGDPLFDGIGPFNPLAQSVADQENRFGYNNDYIGFVALPDDENGNQRALLCVNHEYTIGNLMFSGRAGRAGTAEEAAIEQAAHGGTIVEIVNIDGAWSYVQGSRYNRRITARTEGMELTGPAAGHPRLATTADPEGRFVIGTLNNCAGGITPWGTYLMAEENFNGYFSGEAAGPEQANHERYGVPGGWYNWAEYEARFDLAREPNEPNRFGWVVEIDPMDPQSTPKKRTALGRFKHEGAESLVAPSGQVVLYMGDDQRFDYVYKFVTAGRFNADDRAANRDLLDEGTLYVARFDADGSVEWMPLVYGQGPLTEENDFSSQGEVLIETRRAADLLGATPMDRPEDVQPNPQNGTIYVMLTNNSRRSEDQTDAANPRGPNRFGHIIEITEPNGDFTSTTSRWEILVRCGDPADPAIGAEWGPGLSENGWFGSPDNAAMDSANRLYVSTDGSEVLNQCANGVWRVETEGLERGYSRLMFLAPTGAEICGPRLSDDENTFFLAVQHPADGGEDFPGHARASTFDDPSTRWPDFAPDMPPRPAVVALTRADGKTFSEV